jgi:5-methyltetrahydrofolate--homocysteine methyltransferase
LTKDIQRDDLLAPAGLYGFFPVITDDELVILLDPADFYTELASLRFPRTRENRDRSRADFLRPEGDVFGIQMVTIGRGMNDLIIADSDVGRKESLNKLADNLVEDLADRLTLEITRALVLPPGAGQRVGFGAPGMPPVKEQKALFELLAVEERLGVVLTDDFHMAPKYSRMGCYFHFSA